MNADIRSTKLKEKSFLTTIEIIVEALKEKGYDPYEQLTGYVTENEPCYITKHKNARQLVVTLDMERLKQYVKGMKR